MPDLSLITCTADRPVAFALCERWLSRQSFRGSVEWVVSDGGATPAVCTMGQVHLRNEPHADPRRNFLTNLGAGLARATADKIAIIEDDEWYGPDWLTTVWDMLNCFDLIGEGRAKYYNVATRRYHTCGNTAHASLCQTAFHRSVLEWMLPQLAGFGTTFVDMRLLWQAPPTFTRCLLPASRHVVGIKGLPGKTGIGMGHRLDARHKHDADGSVLRRWVGDDAHAYDALEAM